MGRLQLGARMLVVRVAAVRIAVRVGIAAAIATTLSACATAGSGGSTDAGPDARTGGGTLDASIGDAPPSDAALASCASTDTCLTALMLGGVSGDSQNQKLTASGHRSAWYRVRVSEDNSSIGGLTLRVAAKLTSPASPMFDVFIYVNGGSDQIECSTTTGTVTTNGNTKQVRAEWGEGGISNGSDDGRTVSIEIRPLAQDGCSMAATWQLEVEGNWN